MANPPRPTPLRAEPEAPGGEDHPARSRLRSVLLGIGIGAGVGVATMAIAFSIVAIPMFIVASTEPSSGLDRSLVRTGLFKVALPLGLVAGVVTGIAVGIWYARGGRLPTDHTPIHS
ncbi:MAG: hypothetical protein M3450_15905 [Actinomycetota bacterium]|nr:hypothetical protein [Actinomycetota bacterium]MDQ3782539.1 hypothetical protein [Actinomycetota bacterium]